MSILSEISVANDIEGASFIRETLVTIENPFRVKQFSRMFDENKTDRNDALRIADFLRIQRFTTSPIKEEKYMALQRLTRTRYQLIKQLIRTKQHFLENLT
ncbi:hypothetical protein EfmGK941_30090 (plasmid) [Enterococcus faecium]|nr:hypothetical protein EfmGK941_30090 [Enterococcus faecium]